MLMVVRVCFNAVYSIYSDSLLIYWKNELV